MSVDDVADPDPTRPLSVVGAATLGPEHLEPPEFGPDQAPGEVEPELLPDPDTRRKRKATNSSKLAVEWAILIVAALTIALLIKTFLFQAFVIPSPSMTPTLCGGVDCGTNDRILVNKLSYKLHDVNRGDIVVFATPPGMEQEGVKDFVKRVIGLPGERIEARDAQIYIDGRPLQEPYVNPACPNPVSGETLTTQTIPPDHVFVMGDNRCASKDSRVFGPIPVDTIVGRAFVRIWPLGRFKFL